MSSPAPYLIYLLGPLVLALVAMRLFRSGLRPAGAGGITSLAVWTGVLIVTQLLSGSVARLTENTFLYNVIVAVSAGVLEEGGPVERTLPMDLTA